MSYIALYRKWRPDTFDEVKGQDAIVRTLRNQIIYNRIGHAYLFCGTRGTGKTSVAKLFARAVNCENPQEGNPCNACPSCMAINSQSSLDVHEIDAASNNGVDHVRDIREQVQYSPVSGRYKVYIIDEVHMLSTGAFNALLKTLEEPPSYVIFILATTEKHKIPVTILSRCQKYDFRRISTETIAGHLSVLMKREQIQAEEKALSYIARSADGSMRDALSLLDQCISFYLNQPLTYDNVLAVLGTVDVTVFSGLFRSLIRQDTRSVLALIDQAVLEGRDLAQFLSDFLWYIRNLLILKGQDGAEDNLDMSTENIALLKEEAALVTTGTLMRYIRVLSDLSGQIRGAAQKRILVEVGFIRLCLPQMETDTDSLLERIRLLEEKIDRAGALAPATHQQADLPSPSPGRQTGNASAAEDFIRTDTEALESQFSPAEASDLKEIASNWAGIIRTAGKPMQNFLRNVRPVVSEDSRLIQLMFEQDDMARAYFERDHQHNLSVLSDLVAQITGKQVHFECITVSQARAGRANYIDLSKIHQEVIFE